MTKTRRIICYDLHGANSADYAEMYKYIEATYNGIRATESVYVIFSNKDNKTIVNDILSKYGNNISLLVASLPGGVFTHNIKDTDKWFNN